MMTIRSLCLIALVSLASLGCSETEVESVAGSGSTGAVVQPADSSASAASAADENTASEASSETEVFVIDVRSKDEWDSGHVEIAAHIPHTEIADRISEVTSDKAAKIVVYCKVGGRAGMAKTALEEMGYTNVENAGGFDDVKDRF